MVDANTTVTRSLAWLFWEPVMFIMFCQQLLQALAEGLQLSLAREPLGAEELGDEGHGGGDLAYHGGGPGVDHCARPSSFSLYRTCLSFKTKLLYINYISQEFL